MFLLISSICVVLVAGLCETGWKSFANNCYKVIYKVARKYQFLLCAKFVPEAGLNQPDALVACRKMDGASLASVHSVDEHKFIIGSWIHFLYELMCITIYN